MPNFSRLSEDAAALDPSGRTGPTAALTAGLLLAIAVTMTIGCAKITYQKVPSPVQWGSNWTMEKQIEADKMEGPRFYLPRPFLVVKTPVPIAARVAFISLEYDQSQKNYKLSLPREADTWVKRLLPETVTISQALKVKLATEVSGKQEAGAAGKAADEPGKKEEAPPKEGAAKKEEPTPPTTVIGRVTSLYKEDPVTKLGELFDVVYLPDFDEQFVIGRSFGLGKGDVQISLRNGWAAEVFGEQIDRSNLVPYVINQVENASKAALNIATTWGLTSVGVPVGALPLPTNVGAKQEALATGDDQARALDILGQTVLLKVVEIRVAQPGIYPILKPREIIDWFGVEGQRVIISAVSPDAALAELLRQKGLSWIRPDLALIPAPPFTMMGFNVVNDAYIGAVTKDQLGLGLYTVGEQKAGIGGTTDAEKAKEAIRQALDAKKAAALGPTAQRVGTIDVKDVANNTEVTVEAKNPGDLDGLVAELNDQRAQDWAKATFTLTDVQLKDVKASPNQEKTAVVITLKDLPLSMLIGRITK